MGGMRYMRIKDNGNPFTNLTCWAPIAALVVCLMATPPAVFAADFATSQNGNWNAASTWGGSGPPVAGDSAQIDHNVTLTQDEEFGTSSTESTWSTAGTTLTLGGFTLTLSGSGTFSADANSGSAQNVNSGTFVITNGATLKNARTGGGELQHTASIVNYGTIVMDQNAGAALRGVSTPLITHKAGAVITRTIAGYGRAAQNDFVAEAGSIFSPDAGSEVAFAGTSSSGASSVKNALFQGDGTISFILYWSEISGTRSAGSTSSIELGGAQASNHEIPAGGTIYNVSDANGNTNGLRWSNGYLDTNGNSATNKGVFTLRRASGTPGLLGGGEFVNDTGATFRHNLISGPEFSLSGATTFRNRGLFDLLDDDSDVGLNNASAAFINESTGILRKRASGTSRAEFRATSGATFNNQGTVVADATTASTDVEIELRNTLSLSQWNGSGALTGGVWEAIGNGTDAGILDIQPTGGANSITTIGSSATVKLASNGSIIQLATTTLTVDGTFGVRDQRVYALSSSLTAGGVLEFGLEAADEGGTLLTGIDITGTVDFTGGTVNVTNLGDLVVGTYRIIEWSSTETGSLTLGTPLVGNIGLSLSQNDGGNYVDLIATDASAPVGTMVYVR